MVDRSDLLQPIGASIRPLLTPLAKLGLAEPALDLYVSLTDRQDRIKKIDPRIAEYEIPEEEYRGDVLIPFLFSKHWHGNVPYLALSHAFKTRGYRPIVPVCHDMLPMCLVKSGPNRPDSVRACAICNHETNAWMDAFGLEKVSMDDLLPDGYQPPTEFDDLKSATHRGVDISKYAHSTVRKFLRKHRIDHSDEWERELLRRFTLAGAKLVDVTNGAIDTYDIKAAVAHHSNYNTGGVLLAAAGTRDVPSVSVGPHLNHRTGILGFGNVKNRNSRPPFANRKEVRERLKRPLTDSQHERIDDYMKGRRSGQAIPDNKHWAGGSHSSLSLPDDATTLGLFSNIVWDDSQQGSHIVFNNTFSWVLSTIEAVDDNEDLHLVIKPHPAGASRPTKDEVEAWVSENVDPLPDNVTLLEPGTDVDPYELMRDIDAGIVYNSTLGLEMAYEGIPVIVAGEAHYRGHGFAIEPETTTEYVNVLQNIDEYELTDRQQRLARRYAHFFFFEKMIEVPLYKDEGAEELKPITHEDLRDSAAFDFIIDQILADKRTIAADPETLESVIPEDNSDSSAGGSQATVPRESSR
jgi:hypothetical protein